MEDDYMVSVGAIVEGFILAIIITVVLSILGVRISSGIASCNIWFSTRRYNRWIHIIW